MKLIVGLGNPGKEYENTRHNIGFMVIDNYAKIKNNNVFKKKMDGLYNKMSINGEDVILLKPLSYMNLSGIIVRKYVNYFKIKPEDIFIIHDDLDLPLGKKRIKYKGSSGGHNGIKNIIENLHTDVFSRLKIGVGNNKLIDTKDYVLGRFSKEEKEIINNEINECVSIIDDFLCDDVMKLMNKYNGD